MGIACFNVSISTPFYSYNIGLFQLYYMSIQYLPNFVVQKVIPNSQKLTESELSMNTMFLFMNFVPLEMRRKNKD